MRSKLLMMAIARSQEVSLDVRQHPMYALLTAENKEKSESSSERTCDGKSLLRTVADSTTVRKPVDPPPIVELKVHSDKQ